MDLTTVHRVLQRLTDAGTVAPTPRDSSVGYRIAERAEHCLTCQTCGLRHPADRWGLALRAVLPGSE